MTSDAHAARFPDTTELLDRLPVAVFVADASGRPVYANAAAKELLGRDIDREAGPGRYAEVYHAFVAGTEEPYPAERMPIVRALAGEASAVDDLEIRRPDGTARIQVWGSPIVGDDGAVRFAVAAFRDVTHQKQAEEELQLAHELALAIAAADSAEEAFRATLTRLCVHAGWAFGQVWTRSADGAHYETAPGWYAEREDLAAFRAASERLRLPTARLGPVARAFADREAVWVDDVRADPLYMRAPEARQLGLVTAVMVPVLAGDEAAAVLEFLVLERRERDARTTRMISAITGQLGTLVGRKQAEDRLRHSEERFRAVAESAHDSIITVDDAGTIVYANVHAEALLCGDDEVLLGAGVTSVLGSDEWDRLVESRRTVEIPARRGPDEMFVEASLARWEFGGRSFFTAILRDVTERTRAREDLRRALEIERHASRKLRVVDAAKDSFLHAISHELRGPLAAISGAAAVLESETEQPTLAEEDRRRLLENIVATVEEMNRLITDLLYLDRLVLGVVRPRRTPTDVRALVERMVERSEGLQGRDVAIDAEGVVAAVDEIKVERIVDNLLSNAAKYSPPGSPVWVRVRGDADEVLISVEDAGPGVPVELRELIFEPFSRAPKAERRASGLGIGLSLVARFAELHGGRAWVEDRPGGGAAFRVLLPGTAEDLHEADAVGS